MAEARSRPRGAVRGRRLAPASHRRLGLRAGLILAVATLVAACGSTNTGAGGVAPTASPSVNAAVKVICQLVTKDQAQTASGVTFPSAPAAISKAHGAECRYDADKGLVSVQVDDGQGIDSGRAAFAGASTQPVTGLADEAIWNPALYVLWVRKGNAALTIQIVNLNVAKDTIKANAITLANQILPKLSTS